MTSDELIAELSKIHPKGFDLSLGRITDLLEKLGNPQDRLPPVIHVAGTNGKGSTIAFARAILEAAGYSVHVHTSPHLVNWHERYRIAGKLVEEPILADAISRVADANDGQAITVFEILSAVMFVLFSEHKADYALVEVGLGGRFDATNVIENPLVSAIAPVALDHQAYLGDTIEKIAFEKAGIIKSGRPVAIGVQSDEARQVIEDVSSLHKSYALIAGQDFDFYQSGTGFIYQDGSGLLDLPMPALIGEHQMENAALAIAAIRAARIKVKDDDFAQGMKTAQWPARFQRMPKGRICEHLGDNAVLWLDGGHNPAAGNAIASELARQDKVHPMKTTLVCGMINTKDPSGFFAPFSAIGARVLTVPVNMSDAGIAADELAACASNSGLEARSFESLEAAIQELAPASANDRILFCGSLYLAGEVLEFNGTPPT